MDPLSTISGTLAVLTAAGHALQGLEKLWDLRNRDREFAALCERINGVRTVLVTAKVALVQMRNSAPCTASLQSHLVIVETFEQQTKNAFAELEDIIKDINGKGAASRVHKLSKRTWLRRKPKLLRLTEQIVSSSHTLSTSLDTIQGVHNGMIAHEHTLRLDLALSRLEVLSPSPDPGSQDAEPIQLQGQSDMATVSRRSSCTSFKSAISTLPASSMITAVDTGDQPTAEGCEQFCPCRCHTSSDTHTPWFMAHIFGRTVIHGNSSTLLRRPECNKKHCRRSGSTRLQILWAAPFWLLLKEFSVYVRVESMCGGIPSLSLFLPRMIPSSAIVWSLIELGKISEVRNMLSHQEISVHDVNTRGVSLLKYAVIKGQVEICHLLLSRGADACFRDESGSMAMQPGIDRMLSGTQVDRNPSGHSQAFSELFERSDYLDMQSFTLPHLIILGKRDLDLEMVLKYVHIDIDEPDVNGRTALLWAAWRGNLAQVDLLLRHGADADKVDAQSWTPLAKACKAGHVDVARRLLKAKASPTIASSRGYQPIHHASGNAENGARIVQLLVAEGADPNARTRSFATPLHNAANRGSVDTLEILLDCGSDINATDEDGDTPVMTALLCWNEATFTYLVHKDARLDMNRKSGHTVVHAAVWGSHIRVWDLLTDQAGQGKLPGIIANIEHNGHNLRTCLENCRNIWYTGSRDFVAELVAFHRLMSSLR
ncbi:hypothetical protein NX059_000758 [Plenodomus lindquistii]|nr:hypothetical protein NX059_000758 [Plenodomus lindquistii]